MIACCTPGKSSTFGAIFKSTELSTDGATKIIQATYACAGLMINATCRIGAKFE